MWGKAALEDVAEVWVGIWGPTPKDLSVSDYGSQFPAPLPLQDSVLSGGSPASSLPPAPGQKQNRRYCCLPPAGLPVGGICLQPG